MHICLCNDDGFLALGIRMLALELGAAGHRVTIVAPTEERSGFGHAISFYAPLLARRESPGVYSVRGTPADSAFVALKGILAEDPPDLVISGINHGLNVGLDVNYSGTVGAATQAVLMGFRAIAVSMDVSHSKPPPDDLTERYMRVGTFIARLVSLLPEIEWPLGEVLNVNHPGTPPTGVSIASCDGALERYEPFLERMKPEHPGAAGDELFFIGGTKEVAVTDPDQDISVLRRGAVALSFLQTRQNSVGHEQVLVGIVTKLHP